MIKEDKRATCEWAASMMACDDCCILDLETTDLCGTLVEIAVIDREGTVLFHSLINPQAGVRVVYQICDEGFSCAPTLLASWDHLVAVLSDKMTVLTYNTEFSTSTLERDARRYGLLLPLLEWECLMLKYGEHVGEWWE